MCFPKCYGIIVIKEWQDINKQYICSNLLGSQLMFLYYNCTIYCAYLLSSWYRNYLFLKLQSLSTVLQVFFLFGQNAEPIYFRAYTYFTRPLFMNVCFCL